MVNTTVPPDDTTSTGPGIDETTSTGPDLDPTTGFTTVDTDPGPGTDTEPFDPDDPLPNGAQCSVDEDCASLNCYEAGPLGGICGECDEDADCPGGGCTIPNPLTSEPSECNDGSFGSGCETSAVCTPGLVCNPVIDVEGILEVSTCGDCINDMDCLPGETCQPDTDIANFAGQWECVGENSLPNGHGCDPDNGANACMSGECEEVTFMALLDLGVCGECDNDQDCPPGDVCVHGDIDLTMGLIPSFCE